MNYKQYKDILNNVEKKSPIESGVQTLVYMFLYDLFEDSNYDIVVVDNLHKKSIFTTYAGISDLAVVTDDFDYENGTKEQIKFCIEIKDTSKQLGDYYEQILGQLLTYEKALITNGKEWVYYDINDYIGKNKSDDIGELWAKRDLKEIENIIDKAILNERKVACLKSSLAHTEETAIVKRKEIEDEISQIDNELKSNREEVKGYLDKNEWINTFLNDEPTWNCSLFDDGSLNREKFLELKQHLYGVLKKI